jgi:hypothetical protein
VFGTVRQSVREDLDRDVALSRVSRAR